MGEAGWEVGLVELLHLQNVTARTPDSWAWLPDNIAGVRLNLDHQVVFTRLADIKIMDILANIVPPVDHSTKENTKVKQTISYNKIVA